MGSYLHVAAAECPRPPSPTTDCSPSSPATNPSRRDLTALDPQKLIENPIDARDGGGEE